MIVLLVNITLFRGVSMSLILILLMVYWFGVFVHFFFMKIEVVGGSFLLSLLLKIGLSFSWPFVMAYVLIRYIFLDTSYIYIHSRSESKENQPIQSLNQVDMGKYELNLHLLSDEDLLIEIEDKESSDSLEVKVHKDLKGITKKLR